MIWLETRINIDFDNCPVTPGVAGSSPVRSAKEFSGKSAYLPVSAFFSSRFLFQSRVFRSKVWTIRLSVWLESRSRPSLQSWATLRIPDHGSGIPTLSPPLIYAPNSVRITLRALCKAQCALRNTYPGSTTSDVQTPPPMPAKKQQPFS